MRRLSSSLIPFTHVSDYSRSIAVNKLLEDSSRDEACVLHYFCDFTARRQQNDLTILQSILRQVVKHDCEEIIPILSRCRRGASSVPMADELFSALKEICNKHKVYLIVDAPDELDAPKSILSRLQSLVGVGGRVLVTSRDHPDLRAAFSPGRHFELYSHPEDMVLYILHRFQESDFHGLMGKTHTIVEEVAQKANSL